MRRISWIDSMNQGRRGHVFGFCRGRRLFFSAVADQRDAGRCHHGEGENHQVHVRCPAMPGSSSRSSPTVFGFKLLLIAASMAFDRDQRFNGCSSPAPGGEEAWSSSAMRRRISRPASTNHHLHLFNRSALEIGQSRHNTNRAACCPLVPAPADRRFQSDQRRVWAMSAAVTGDRWVRFAEDRNT